VLHYATLDTKWFGMVSMWCINHGVFIMINLPGYLVINIWKNRYRCTSAVALSNHKHKTGIETSCWYHRSIKVITIHLNITSRTFQEHSIVNYCLIYLLQCCHRVVIDWVLIIDPFTLMNNIHLIWFSKSTCSCSECNKQRCIMNQQSSLPKFNVQQERLTIWQSTNQANNQTIKQIAQIISHEMFASSTTNQPIW